MSRCSWRTATLRRVSCDTRATCFRGDLTALVLSMFQTWRRPRRPYCDLQRCMRSHNDPAAISGDLADFPDRSEVAVLCDWGINKAPVTQDGDHGDLGNPPDRRVVARYQKKRSSVWQDRAALARRSDARPLWAQLRFHYDLCVSTTLIPRPHGALDTRSVRPFATLQRCHYDIGDCTTLLGRSRRVCCAHTASVPRSYGDHRRFAAYLAPFHGKLECFRLIF